MDGETITVRDLIYFDVEKAASILSQIEGGLLRETEAASESSVDRRNVRQYDLKIFKPEFGGITTDTEKLVEKRVVHHELLTRLEELLFKHHLAVNINTAFTSQDIKEGKAHKSLQHLGYTKITGWASIDSYERIQFIIGQFDELIKFFIEHSKANFTTDPQVASFIQTLDNAKLQLKSITDRNQKNVVKRQIKDVEQQIDDILEQSISKLTDALPKYLQNGINTFIDTFYSDLIKLTIFPFSEYLEFHAITKLKRECFVDTDIDNVIFAYGSRPNLQLTVFGVLTSVPFFEDKRPILYDNSRVQSASTDKSHAIGESFDSVFTELGNLENLFTRPIQYPKIALYPIALYREITPFDAHIDDD